MNIKGIDYFLCFNNYLKYLNALLNKYDDTVLIVSSTFANELLSNENLSHNLSTSTIQHIIIPREIDTMWMIY